MNKRGSGILLHISSLPSPHGIGDLGPGAYRFADFLVETGQSLWQILPLNPTSPVLGNSPYSSFSAFACNPLFISLELLVEDGLLLRSETEEHPAFSSDFVDYDLVMNYKGNLLKKTFERYKSHMGQDGDFELFCMENSSWLDDYAIFAALRDEFGGAPWSEWPGDLRNRDEGALSEWGGRLREKVLYIKFLQHLFHRQWTALTYYCSQRNIRIIGDLPIYVSFDSCDVWANTQIFKLDHEKRPVFVSGVPPDYFSSTGQLWGTPVYSWDTLRGTGYSWWIKRLERNLKLFSCLRLDHFRGFVGYWEVPAHEETAINGRWEQVPTEDFFNTLMRHFPSLPIIAEDLGIITPDVREVMAAYRFPGMKLLIFAFGDDMPTNPYILHNIIEDCIVYTGTHDNNTIRGWFLEEASDSDRERLFRYMGRDLREDEVPWEFVRHAMMSVAKTAVIPMQDILGLGREARMNTPSICHGNWRWRLTPERLTPDLVKKLALLAETYGRK